MSKTKNNLKLLVICLALISSLILTNASDYNVVLAASNFNAFEKIEAENYTEMSGVIKETCSDTGGGQDIGSCENNDYIAFDSVNFGAGLTCFQAKVASAVIGGNIEVRLDSVTGTLVGVCEVTNTGGWQVWATKTIPISIASGNHKVYLVFKGSHSGGLLNVNWVKFLKGRVQISDGTIKTDIGTLLRGVYANPDISATDLTLSQLADLKSNGCNSLHLYAESSSTGKAAGINLARIDNYVDMTEQLGIYCVITIGGGACNATYIMDFWTIYAPRYKDRHHVVYEIKNEPALRAGYNSDLIGVEKNAFDLIRGFAPNTHIMMFSYCELVSWTSIKSDIDSINALGMNWTNASIAWHGYERNIDSIISTFSSMKTYGYASISTELPAFKDSTAAANMLNMCETLGCSWLNFVNAKNITNDTIWRNPIDLGGVIWTPDYGTWPDVTSISPYVKKEAEDFNSQSGIYKETCIEGGQDVASCNNNDYIAFSNVNFSTGAATFEVRVASLVNGGNIELRLDSTTGTLVGTCAVQTTGGWQTWVTKTCTVSGATGKHNLYLVFSGTGSGGLFNINWFKFYPPSISATTTIQAEDYVEQKGTITENCSEGGKDIGSCHNTDYIVFDNVDFGTGITGFQARVASALTGGNIEVRLDSLTGTLVGTCTVTNTGGWQTWTTKTCGISGAEGIHKLYLVFVGSGAGGMFNLNWFAFN